MLPFFVIIIVLVIFFLWSAIKILKEYERGVIFRLGRVIKTKGPGLIILIPIIDKMVKVSLRLVAMDVPAQDVITRDNVSVKVNAVVYFRVMNPTNATVETYLNGRCVQKGNTGDMMFSAAYLIHYISQCMTLLPGDIISTGTPKGVSPMQPGDVVEVRIEGIGTLRNSIEAAK